MRDDTQEAAEEEDEEELRASFQTLSLRSCVKANVMVRSTLLKIPLGRPFGKFGPSTSLYVFFGYIVKTAAQRFKEF